MSTSTRNPFSLLDEDYDPSAPAPAVQPKTEEPAPKEIVAKQTTSKKRDPTRQTAGEARRGADSAAKTRNSKPRGPTNANDAFSKDKSVGHDANAAKPVEDSAARGTTRGRGRGRGSGSRREYDRRNATGKTDTAKATEQSWGNEAEAQQTASAEPVDSHDPAAPEAVDNTSAVASAPVEEEEDNTVSYEEYLKQKAEKASNATSLKLREANEGADDSKWGDQAFSRESQNDEYFAGVQKTKSASQKERKQKDMLEIEQKFYQAPATRGRGKCCAVLISFDAY